MSKNASKKTDRVENGNDIENIVKRFSHQLPKQLDYCSLRWVRRHKQIISSEKNILRSVENDFDEGMMICVVDKGGIGYSATADVSETGFQAALLEASRLAGLSAQFSSVDYSQVPFSHEVGRYDSSGQAQIAVNQYNPWQSVSLADKVGLLQMETEKLKTHDKIVHWGGELIMSNADVVLLTNQGGEICQSVESCFPNLWVTAHDKGETQRRSLAGGGRCMQGGWEQAQIYLCNQAERLSDQVIQLLYAENCPSINTDLLLMPDQLMLQIHESIGHPLELDRILGDERNYAGTSFVGLEMFGNYQYGSDLLNVSFDPTVNGELASCSFDDEGTPATKQMLIENGKLIRGLGGRISQTRANTNGVANARAETWNRAPTDRIANLNIEPGDTTLEQMIASTEKGVLMESNCSWSIDDSRNKFQFGCEWGQLIENGELTRAVKNPNYRGVSSQFWRNLIAVGSEFDVFGTPYCGKAEPNALISVGHAAAPCLFRDVAVFGGD